MDIIHWFISFLHDPRPAVESWILNFGSIWVYAPLFLVIFCETGLVFTPFLPGDSLLLTAGFFAHGEGLNIFAVLGLMYLAAVLGDTCNYFIGREFGEVILKSKRVKINPEYVERTEHFFDKHGGKSLFIARFFPIIRTFAPFLAGIGHMPLKKFWTYNVLGGVTWVTLFTLLGYFLGGQKWFNDNFSMFIMVLVAVSFAPSIVGVLRQKFKGKTKIDTPEEFVEGAILDAPAEIDAEEEERKARYGTKGAQAAQPKDDAK